MNLLLIGAPGSGKGTQGVRLAKRFDIEHLATGDMLRSEVESGTELGHRVADTMRRGELVDDETIVELVVPRIVAAAKAGGYLLDGFPRTVAQVEQARKMVDDESVAPDAVLFLEVPDDELTRQVLARADDARDDDTAETVANRLRVYNEVTHPLIDHYRERGLLHRIDGRQDMDKVYADILAALGEQP